MPPLIRNPIQVIGNLLCQWPVCVTGNQFHGLPTSPIALRLLKGQSAASRKMTVASGPQETQKRGANASLDRHCHPLAPRVGPALQTVLAHQDDMQPAIFPAPLGN